MIKFFQKIRRDILAENKIGKYLKYAVGEIVLVVIGILIAIQVNNWNEHQKIIHRQNSTLKKLQADLKYDLVQFNYLDSIYKSWEKDSEYILDTVLSGTLDNLTSPNQLKVGRGSPYYLNIKLTTYKEMLNTGTFYSLENEVLREQLSGHYEFVNFELTKLNRDNESLQDYLLNSSSSEEKNSIMLRLSIGKNLDKLNWDWLQDSNSELYKRLEFETAYWQGAINATRKLLSELTVRTKVLIENIEMELSQ